MISVALLSNWHVHGKDYAKEANQNPEISIKAVWDEDKERGKAWAIELGVPFESDLQNVLSNPEIDAVIVTAPTNLHKEIIIEAAKHGKHIFTEKVLAFTVEDCNEIYKHVEAANVNLMVSLPRLVEPYYLYAQDVLDRGTLGELNLIRCRVAHDGAIPFAGHPHGWLPASFFEPGPCGGGAFIDLGAHPVYLTNRLAGPAKAISARLQPFLGYEVDTNAVAIVEYLSGAMGILETSFVSGCSPFFLEMHGTKGSLLIEDEQIRIKCSQFREDGWVVPNELPHKLPSPMEQWVLQIQEGITPSISKTDAVALTQINQYAAQSNQAGRRISII